MSLRFGYRSFCSSGLCRNVSFQIRQSNYQFYNFSSSSDALVKNQDLEFERNKERFTFLKWGAKAFNNMLIVPPGSGIVHQVNLEYLARVVFDKSPSGENILFPDTVVGTDSHTTMINGLGVVGWGVGGIEAEAVMLGQSIAMLLPEVIGYKLIGKLSLLATSTDLVLTVRSIEKHVCLLVADYLKFSDYKKFETVGCCRKVRRILRTWCFRTVDC